MTMDPRLYQKYSGRSGDPYSRLGAALSQADARKSQLTEEKGRSFTERRLRAKRQVNVIVLVIILAAVAGTGILKMILGR